MSSSCIVPSLRSDPIGHLANGIFESKDHLLLCHINLVYRRWNFLDQYFSICFPVQCNCSVIELGLIERDNAAIESF